MAGTQALKPIQAQAHERRGERRGEERIKEKRSNEGAIFLLPKVVKEKESMANETGMEWNGME